MWKWRSKTANLIRAILMLSPAVLMFIHCEYWGGSTSHLGQRSEIVFKNFMLAYYLLLGPNQIIMVPGPPINWHPWLAENIACCQFPHQWTLQCIGLLCPRDCFTSTASYPSGHQWCIFSCDLAACRAVSTPLRLNRSLNEIANS